MLSLFPTDKVKQVFGFKKILHFKWFERLQSPKDLVNLQEPVYV